MKIGVELLTATLHAYVELFIDDAARGLAGVASSWAARPARDRFYDDETLAAWLEAAALLQQGASGQHYDPLIEVIAALADVESVEVWRAMLAKAKALAAGYRAGTYSRLPQRKPSFKRAS